MTFGYNGNMSRLELSPDKWTKILQFLRSRTDLYVGQEEECRRFIEAVLWVDRSRRPMATPSSRVWELEQRLQKVLPLGRPGYLGTPASAFGRRPGYGIPHHRQHGGPGPPLRCGSALKKGGQAAQALGRSRGGFSTKVHVSVDSLGNPLRFILTGGQQHDITQAEGLIDGLCR